MNKHEFSNIKFYEILDTWFKEYSSKNLAEDLSVAEGDYKLELIKKSRKLDFLKTFVIICEMSYEFIDNPKTVKNQVKNIIGSVFGRIIFETSQIMSLNKTILDFDRHTDSSGLFGKWVEDRRNGYIWIKDTDIDFLIDDILDNSLRDEKIIEIPETIDVTKAKLNKKYMEENITGASKKSSGLTYYEYAKYEFAVISGSSFSDIESMMARGISRTSLCNILYSFILIRLFISSLCEDFYITWHEDSDLFKGKSGSYYFFNGLVILDQNEDSSNPWLLKCITTTHNPLDALESVSSILSDINMHKCILFVPTYPSEKAMRYFVYSYAEKRQEIVILYLNDLYELLKIPPSDVNAYLRTRRISS